MLSTLQPSDFTKGTQHPTMPTTRSSSSRGPAEVSETTLATSSTTISAPASSTGATRLPAPGLPPPDPVVISHSVTPAARIEDLRRYIIEDKDPAQRINLETVIKYYEDGGRCPQGQEELWAINGQLYWGILRQPDDFPNGSYWDQSAKFREVSHLFLPRLFPPAQAAEATCNAC